MQKLYYVSVFFALFFVFYVCSMEDTVELASAMRKFGLRDQGKDLCAVCRRDSDSLLLSATRQHLPRVMSAMLNCDVTVQEHESAIFLSAARTQDFELLRVLVDKHALVDLAGFDALLSIPDSIRDVEAKIKITQIVESLAREILKRVPVSQYAALARDALARSNKRVVDFLRACGYLPRKKLVKAPGDSQEFALWFLDAKSKALAVALAKRGAK